MPYIVMASYNQYAMINCMAEAKEEIDYNWTFDTVVGKIHNVNCNTMIKI